MSLKPAIGKVLAAFSAREYEQSSDKDLLQRFVATGDQSAFAVLVERHASLVLGVSRRVLDHVQDAEDAAQAVFLVFSRNAATIRNPEGLASWLHGKHWMPSRMTASCQFRLS